MHPAVRTLVALALAGAPVPMLAQGQPPAGVETEAPGIPGVVSAGTKVEVIKTGFTGTEGPIALPDGSLIFTETQASRITKIDRDTDETSTFLENTNGSNALAFDAKGRLISVQTTPGKTQVGVIYPKGQEAVLSDTYEGKPYGRPNDLVVNKKGGVYFTEPGPSAAPGQPPPAPALPPAVYYVPPGRPAVRITDTIARPNGIQLSPDEKTLYVNDTGGEFIVAFDVKGDGSVKNQRNFAAYPNVTRAADGTITSGADGLAVDREGRVYAVALGGVHVFTKKGELMGTIPVTPQPQNLAFAGAAKRTLYIVGRGVAHKIRVLTPGFTGRAK